MNLATMFCDVAAPAAAPAATAAAPATTAAATEASAAATGASQGGGLGMFLPMLLVLGIFYFMMIRPQQRKEKERRRKIEELKAGAKVIFAGGLMGTITEVTEKNTFKVEIAPGTVVEIAKGSVSSEVPAEGAATK